MELKYSVETGEDACKAMGRDFNVSFKNMVVIAKYLRGMNLEKAIADLEATVKLEKPIPFTKFNKGIGHRKGDEVKTGKYPKKAAQYTLEVLQNLRANAEFKGLDPANVVIVHAQANHGVSRPRRRPKGRWTIWETEYCHLQVVGEEKQ